MMMIKAINEYTFKSLCIQIQKSLNLNFISRSSIIENSFKPNNTTFYNALYNKNTYSENKRNKRKFSAIFNLLLKKKIKNLTWKLTKKNIERERELISLTWS